MQESGYHSGLISKDKDHKNLPVSPFFTGRERTSALLTAACTVYGASLTIRLGVVSSF